MPDQDDTISNTVFFLCKTPEITSKFRWFRIVVFVILLRVTVIIFIVNFRPFNELQLKLRVEIKGDAFAQEISIVTAASNATRPFVSAVLLSL